MFSTTETFVRTYLSFYPNNNKYTEMFWSSGGPPFPNPEVFNSVPDPETPYTDWYLSRFPSVQTNKGDVPQIKTRLPSTRLQHYCSLIILLLWAV